VVKWCCLPPLPLWLNKQEHWGQEWVIMKPRVFGQGDGRFQKPTATWEIGGEDADKRALQ